MKTRAIYTGSFDPLTMGHMDIIRRAAAFCDELTVGIIANPSKQPFFSIEEREDMIAEAVADLPNVRVEHFSGLLADFVNRRGFNLLIRGLRSGGDFDYELQMERINSRLFTGSVETVFLMADPAYCFLSSSMVREVYSLGGTIEGLVPQAILCRMEDRRNG